MANPEISDPRPQFRLHASVVVRDDAGEVLLVQEAKAANRGRWNLPGGHVDHGEGLAAAGQREMREETGLVLPLEGLIGVYMSPASARFVFLARLGEQAPVAGDEIMAVRFFTRDEMAALGDEELVAARNFRMVINDWGAGRLYPLDVLHD